MTNEQIFELYQMYFSETKDLYEGYITTCVTITAAILGIIGWFLTSDSARKLVSSSRSVMRGIVLANFLTALSMGWVTLIIHNASKQLVGIISNYANQLSLTADHYTYKVLTPQLILPFYGFHVILLVMLSVIVINKSRNATAA